MKIFQLLMMFLMVTACGQKEAEVVLTAPHANAAKFVKAAKARVGVTTSYDPAYVGMEYPGGDVPNDRGVCIDVVIRALREVDIDLQKVVHEDMKKNFSKYPKRWGLKTTDKNIDHRRVPNVRTYFLRKGYDLPVTKKAKDYLPGDIVTCTVGGNRPHIMVVSDRAASDGTPLIIHNIGSGTKEQNSLFDFPLTGHFRIWK